LSIHGIHLGVELGVKTRLRLRGFWGAATSWAREELERFSWVEIRRSLERAQRISVQERGRLVEELRGAVRLHRRVLRRVLRDLRSEMETV